MGQIILVRKPLVDAGGGPITTANTANPAVNTSNLTSYTFSSQSIGTAVTGRIVVAMIGCAFNSAIGSFSSVTIGGVTATQIASQSDDNGVENVLVGLFAAQVDTGTTADIVVNLSNTGRHCFLSVATLDGASGVAASATASDMGDPVDIDVNTVANGAFLAVVGNQIGNKTITWTGEGTIFNEVTVESNYRYEAVGYIGSTLTAETPRNVQADDGGSPSNFPGVAAAWSG